MWVPLCTHIYVQSLNEDRKWRNVVCRLTEVLLFLYICLRKEGRHLSPLSSRDLGVKNHLVSGITWDLSQEGCHKNYQLLNTITYSETCLIQISSLRAERHAKGSRTTQIPYADRSYPVSGKSVSLSAYWWDSHWPVVLGTVTVATGIPIQCRGGVGLPGLPSLLGLL